MVEHLTSERQASQTQVTQASQTQETSSPTPDVALYDVILRRRDVRREFTGHPVSRTILRRVLEAAHAAPSVGLTQPWDFVVITDHRIRRAFHAHVTDERTRFAETLEGERAQTFAGIKIDGVLEASLNVVLTYDPTRGAPSVLGRYSIADAGLYSVCLAAENLWLACTAEGWGMGWVSFFQESFVSELLGIPDPIRPVAWLCIGPVSKLADVPDLERHGWRERLPLEDVMHADTWTGTAGGPDLVASQRGGTPPIGGRLT